MSHILNFYLDYNVTGAERKRLVEAIANYMQEDAEYLRAPSFAYRVDYLTIDKNGIVSFDSRADSEQIEGLIEVLVEKGFVVVDSNFNPHEEVSQGESEPDSETVNEAEIPLADAEAILQAATDTAIGADMTENAPEHSEAVNKTPPEIAAVTPALPMDVQAQLEHLRTSLIREINRKFDGLLRSGGTTIPPRTRTPAVPSGIADQLMTISLSDDTGNLRGTKPVSVKYNGMVVPASSWKRVAGIVLDICNRQEEYHQALLRARDTMSGRGRRLLADSPQGMFSPLQIDEGLYVETNFSTEALLRFLKERILREIGFDGSAITLEYRRP